MIRSGLLALVLTAGAGMAEPVAPSDAIAKTVLAATTDLFQTIASDPDAAWDSFDPALQETLPRDRWIDARAGIDARTGPRRDARVHGLSFYDADVLLAATDYAQPFEDASGALCGFVLWRVVDADTLSVARIEENIVELETFASMPAEDAIQTLSDWRCPPQMIEAILGVSISE